MNAYPQIWCLLAVAMTLHYLHPFYLHKVVQARVTDVLSASYLTTLCWGQFNNTLQVTTA